MYYDANREWYVMDWVDWNLVKPEPLPIVWDGMEVRYAQEQKEYEATYEAQTAADWS